MVIHLATHRIVPPILTNEKVDENWAILTEITDQTTTVDKRAQTIKKQFSSGQTCRLDKFIFFYPFFLWLGVSNCDIALHLILNLLLCSKIKFKLHFQVCECSDVNLIFLTVWVIELWIGHLDRFRWIMGILISSIFVYRWIGELHWLSGKP